MTKISLEKFIEKTKGTKVDVPWKVNSNLKGQCVSLIQAYIKECLAQPAKARGNAKDWINTYVNERLGKIVSTPQKGDILVFPHDGGDFGHMAIYINKNTLYDQNNGRHDNYKAGYGKIFTNDYIILRPNSKLIEDSIKYLEGNYKCLDNMYILNKPGEYNNHKKVKDIPVNVRKHVVNTKLEADAIYKKNTIFTALEIKKIDSTVWGKSPSGWICLKGEKEYCKKV